jgi:hypothetical protein
MSAQENLESATAALKLVADELAIRVIGENDAMTELAALLAKREHVAVSPADASCAITLLADLARAREAHSGAQTAREAIEGLHRDMARAHAHAVDVAASEARREALPGATALLAASAAGLAAWAKAHRAAINAATAAGLQPRGVGFSAPFFAALESNGVARDLGIR